MVYIPGLVISNSGSSSFGPVPFANAHPGDSVGRQSGFDCVTSHS